MLTLKKGMVMSLIFIFMTPSQSLHPDKKESSDVAAWCYKRTCESYSELKEIMLATRDMLQMHVEANIEQVI